MSKTTKLSNVETSPFLPQLRVRPRAYASIIVSHLLGILEVTSVPEEPVRMLVKLLVQSIFFYIIPVFDRLAREEVHRLVEQCDRLVLEAAGQHDHASHSKRRRHDGDRSGAKSSRLF